MANSVLVVEDEPNIVLSLGADAYITKPFSTREPTDRLKRVLGAGASG